MHSSRLTVTVLVLGAILLAGAIWYLVVVRSDPQWRNVGTAEVEWPATDSVSDLFADASRRLYGGIVVGGAANPVSLTATGVYVLVGDTQRVVTIWQPHEPGDAGGAVVAEMHLEVSHLTKSRYGRVMPDGGRPPVYCDLNQQQRDHVLQNGIPQSLVDAMLRAADAAGWQPLPFGVDDRTTDATTIIWVQPAPHFPK